MDAVRLIVEALLLEALLLEAAASLRESAGRAATPAAARPHDPYTLAARPLPARLRLFPHPRGLSEADARRITGGKVD